MSIYNKNIDVFDAYLSGTMSEKNKLEFESQLKADEELSKEFTFHKELVAVLQHTAEESDLEFGKALRHISDQEIERIAEKKSDNSKIRNQGRVVLLKKVYSWAVVAAAVVMIAGVGGYQYHQIQTKNRLCDAIFIAGFNPDMSITRSGNQEVNTTYSAAVNKLKNGETEAAISELEKLYNGADDDMKIECGTTIAYAYVKAHKLDKAWDRINEVKSISQRLYGETPHELEALIQAMNGQNLK